MPLNNQAHRQARARPRACTKLQVGSAQWALGPGCGACGLTLQPKSNQLNVGPRLKAAGPDGLVVDVARQYGEALGLNKVKGFAIFSGTGLNALHKFLVLALRVGNYHGRGSGGSRKLLNFVGMVHANFNHRHAMARSQSQQSHWQPNVIIQVAAGYMNMALTKGLKQGKACHFFDGCLPIGAKHCCQGPRPPATPMAG
jgi:hypothetical protein